jgi:hypothetical protein
LVRKSSPTPTREKRALGTLTSPLFDELNFAGGEDMGYFDC